MTYCLGIQVEEGLIAIADTRVLTGHETRISKKTWVHQTDTQAMFVMTSGLRSVRDKVIANFEEILAMREKPFDRLFRAVDVFAGEIRKVAKEDKAMLAESGLRFNLHAIIGGQCGFDRTHKLFLVYPEGNWVEVATETPYEIIGNSGYGKPILARSLHYYDSLQYAFKLGILSFDSSRVCAADVDFPIDVMLYPKGSFQVIEHRYHEPDLREISTWWQDRLRKSVQELPTEKVEAAFSKLAQGEPP
ncbi:MAG: peptidase [Bryobacterales bacterium]|nr:peptidase [Bryobacterales bacterium]